MSGDGEQEYFADGITEDLITELARFQNLVVIARNSTFTFKGKAPRVKDVARDLGVHYVVEGSVRKAGNRVRVTVQLIESKSEKHVWAERYDRDLTDIFEIQDEVTQAIIGALPSRLEAADIERIKRKPPQDLAAYDYVLRSKILHHPTGRSSSTRTMHRLTRGKPAPCGRPSCAVMLKSRTRSTRNASPTRKRPWRSTRTTWSASGSSARSIWNKTTWTRPSTITTAPSR
jgi:adenylate cyclase